MTYCLLCFIGKCYTEIQEAQGVVDSLEVFKSDTLRMARDMADPALVRTIPYSSLLNN